MKIKIIVGVVLAVVALGGAVIGVFTHLNNKSQQNDIAVNPNVPTTPAYFEVRKQDESGNYVPTGIDSRYLVAATANLSFPPDGPFVVLTLNNQGQQLLQLLPGIAETHKKGKAIAVFIDGNLVESTDQGAVFISGKGTLDIAGEFLTKDGDGLGAVKNMAQRLNAGKGLTAMPNKNL